MELVAGGISNEQSSRVGRGINEAVTEFSYDRSTQLRPEIDPWRSDLDEMLAENARQPMRQRLTLDRVYEELRNRGYDGSYDAVREALAKLEDVALSVASRAMGLKIYLSHNLSAIVNYGQSPPCN